MIICNIGMINRPEIYGRIQYLKTGMEQLNEGGPSIPGQVYSGLLKKASLEKSLLSDPENEKLQK